MSKIIGIDLGTGFSAVSIMEGNSPKIIPNSEGQRTTPSIVAWTKSGERLVGQAAKRQAITNPKNTVFEVKRLIGRKYKEVLDEIKKLPYEVVEAANGDCRIKIDDKLYSPEEISAFILMKLKADAEAYLGDKVTEAIITCPAYFNNDQRQATKDAGQIAGLNVLRVINEPTAAALAYGIDKKGTHKVIAVTDAGSGTYDQTILDLTDGVYEVLATNGDTQLGGKDYDQKIIDWLVEEFKSENGIDLSKDPMAVQRLKDEAEKAKIALSTTESVDINLPFISASAAGPVHLQRTLTRAAFERMIEPLNDRYDEPCRLAKSDAAVDIDEVILVGGTTRIPSVQAKIKSIFGIEPSRGINPDEAVSMGAAIQGGVLAGDVTDVLLLDVTPLTLGICVNEDQMQPMIDKNTTIPCKKSNTFTTAVDGQPAVTIRICQGERPTFSNNKSLGMFNLTDIPPAPRGVPQIEVTFDIDASGILTVTAKDLGTQKEQKITITGSSGLSKEEIEKMTKDAEMHADEDKKTIELNSEKNKLEGLCYGIEKVLKDSKDKLSEDVIKTATEKISSSREAMKSNDIDKIKRSFTDLSDYNAKEIASKIYSQTNSGAPNFTAEDIEKMKNDPKFAEMFKGENPFTGGTSQTTGSNDDTIEAEVIDDNK